MTDIIAFLDNNENFAVYTGANIHALYRYLYVIGSPTKFTTSVQRYHHFVPLSSTIIDPAATRPVIKALCV